MENLYVYILGLKGLKELLRTYKLSLLLNEYGDSNFISKFKFTEFLLQFLFQKNDLVFLAVLICDPSL